MKISLAPCVLFLALAACSEEECEGFRNKISPDAAAKQYLSDLKVPYVGISCTQVDTDNDGYVTCTVSTQQQNLEKGVTFLSLQCAVVGGRSSGCKPTPPAKTGVTPSP